MAKQNRILFVEGLDDLHTIKAICEHFKVEETFAIEIPDNTGKVNPRAKPTEKGGIDNVFKAAESALDAAAYSIERVGIVIDADEDLGKRWRRVAKILAAAGYQDLPDSPDENGTVVKQEFLPVFGVWIMPDNKIERGFLETFLTFLVPENDAAWAKAKNCVAELDRKPFVKTEVDHTQKAEIHTFLAWQAEPGKPFGQAITARYLQADKPQCRAFVEWLQNLFVR